MARTITNSNVDTAAAAVPGPWGPLTRVTDVTTLPTPNSDIDLQFTGARGTTYRMSMEQLEDADVRLDIILRTEGFQGNVEDIKTRVAAINTTLAAMTYPHTYLEYKGVIEALRNIVEIAGYYE